MVQERHHGIRNVRTGSLGLMDLVEAAAEAADSDEGAAVIAVGDEEGVLVDPVDGVLEEFEAEVAGGGPVHGDGPTGFRVVGEWGEAGDADGLVAGGGELGEEALIG